MTRTRWSPVNSRARLPSLSLSRPPRFTAFSTRRRPHRTSGARDGDSEGRRADSEQRVLVAQPHVAGDPGEQRPRLAGHVDAAADQPAVVGEHGDRQRDHDSDHRPARPATAGRDEGGPFAAKRADQPGARRSCQPGDRADERDQRQLDADDDQRRGDVAPASSSMTPNVEESAMGANVPGRGRGPGKPEVRLRCAPWRRSASSWALRTLSSSGSRLSCRGADIRRTISGRIVARGRSVGRVDIDRCADGSASPNQRAVRVCDVGRLVERLRAPIANRSTVCRRPAPAGADSDPGTRAAVRPASAGR